MLNTLVYIYSIHKGSQCGLFTTVPLYSSERWAPNAFFTGMIQEVPIQRRDLLFRICNRPVNVLHIHRWRGFLPTPSSQQREREQGKCWPVHRQGEARFPRPGNKIRFLKRLSNIIPGVPFTGFSFHQPRRVD